MTNDELRQLADGLRTVVDGCLDSPDVHAVFAWAEHTLRILADTENPREAWRAAERNAAGAREALHSE